ncbi:MAG: transcription termination/antitermination protein NusA [Nitrospira bacterium HGW-Nitrospira-1]|nr:MAG: transcription termination/antitermination protein NusA [Nitrospira bacterium HGW-Nitrospira-1]
MTKELCHAIEQISREKGISKEILIGAIEEALLSAMRKKYGGRTNIHLTIDRTRCEITVYETKKIVTDVVAPLEEISVHDAVRIDPDKKEGETIDFPLDLHDLGRIAAQTAKQVIFQRVGEAEREVIYNEYKDKVGRIVSGIVMRKEKGAYFLNLGKAEAVLYFKDTLPNENLKRGDTVKAIIEDVKITSRGPSIVVSRSSPQLVGELFRMEVPEIHEGLVVIKDIVREPGERTKIAVYSKNHSVDPVGSCVGMKGTRVQTIVRELRGERIDIIPWNDDPRALIASALSPASVEKIGINEEEKTAMVVVNDQMLSLAIGKRGQNVRLAMKLTGWDIDIVSDTEYSKIRMEETDKILGDSLKIAAGKKDTPSLDG